MGYLVPFASDPEGTDVSQLVGQQPTGSLAEPLHSKCIPVPRSRALICDLLRLNRLVPSCAHDRELNLARVAELRNRTRVRISWPVLFVKAYASVASRYPVLRQTYMPWPWPHIYEHPYSVAMLAVTRQIAGESWLFFGRFTRPESLSLDELQRQLNAYQTEPPEIAFRRQYRLSHWPAIVRRGVWWMSLWLNGIRRSRRVGTFGLTTISARGASIQQPPSILTSTITYGPIDERGRCKFTIAYDHRLMDGLLVAAILEAIQHEFDSAISTELANLCQSPAHRTAA